MSYGPSYVDLFRRAGDYVHRILQGAKPGDMPVEQPTRFELVLNLTTARALGLRVSEQFLLRVDGGDRIGEKTSLMRTSETCRQTSGISVLRGRPEVIGERRKRRD